MKIFTIGYEGVTQAQLIEALRAAGVEVLADVRALPLSRRPGFSKNILASGLREAGIDPFQTANMLQLCAFTWKNGG